MNRTLILDHFYPRAKALRQVFDRRMVDPLQVHSQRFVWDYWHVPGEYTHLRTPAFHYFPKNIYEPFHRYLVRFGREQLGCHDISPPWLSCYVDGCRQNWHRDVPHGPLAFVFSLTNWSRRKFSGGQTLIQATKVAVAPEFNRLVVFNPHLRHGVRKVRGTHDPREGRLVVHGWFVNPRAFWTGPLKAAEVDEAVHTFFRNQPLAFLRFSGFWSHRLHIRASGSVSRVQSLICTLPKMNTHLGQRVHDQLMQMQFPPKKQPSRLTLPLLFT